MDKTLITILIMALCTFILRYIPFLFFKDKKLKIISYLQYYMPPATITILTLYCLRNVTPNTNPYYCYEIIAVVSTVILHLYKGNPILTIFGGTGLYMFLIKVVA